MFSKYLFATLLTAALAFLGGLYLPWWVLAVAAFLAAILIPQKPWQSFLSGFVGVFLLWEILSWLIDHSNNSILSLRVASLFQLGNSTGLLIVITATLGGIVGGCAAISGTFFRRLVVVPKTS